MLKNNKRRRTAQEHREALHKQIDMFEKEGAVNAKQAEKLRRKIDKKYPA